MAEMQFVDRSARWPSGRPIAAAARARMAPCRRASPDTSRACGLRGLAW